MPYKVKHRGSGFKVTTPNHPQGFSKHPMSKKKAVAQLRAIKMNTNENLAARLVDLMLESNVETDPEKIRQAGEQLWQARLNQPKGITSEFARRQRERLKQQVAAMDAAKKDGTKPKPKGIYFSGAGYSGSGMHVAGGSGSIDGGHFAP